MEGKVIFMPEDFATCPDCGAAEFYLNGFIAYRSPYDAKVGEFGNTEILWDEDYATGASCASCNRDVTELFQKFRVAVFHALPDFKKR